MLLNLFYIWIALMPFLSISPWQVIVAPPFYYGFVYYFILLVFALLILRDVSQGKTAAPFNRKDLLVLGYVAVCIMTLLLNWNIPEAENPANVSGFTRFHIYNVFLIVYLIANICSVFVVRFVINSKEILNKALNIITTSSLLACLWGIVMVILHITNMIPPEILGLGPFFPRLMGTATEPQVFGNFLILPLFITLSAFILSPGIKKGLALFVVGTAFIMTFSAGAWIGAFVAIIAFYALNFKYISGKVMIGLAALLIAAILFLSMLAIIYPKYSNSLIISKFFFWNIKKEVQEYKVTKDYPDDKLHRAWMAQAAVNMFREKPILGVGLGNYGYIYNQYRPDYAPRFEFLVKTHNAFLEILAETGLVGFIMFFSWLAIIFLSGLKRALAANGKDIKLALAALLCSFLGILMHGLALGIFMHNHTWVMLGILLAAISIIEYAEME